MDFYENFQRLLHNASLAMVAIVIGWFAFLIFVFNGWEFKYVKVKSSFLTKLFSLLFLALARRHLSFN